MPLIPSFFPTHIVHSTLSHATLIELLCSLLAANKINTIILRSNCTFDPVYKHDLIPTILVETIGLHSNKFVPFEILTIKRLRFLIESPPSPPKQ